MMQRMMSRSFEEHLETLQLLSRNVKGVNLFTRTYEDLLGQLRDDLRNAGTVEEVRTIRERGQMLKALLAQQIEYVEELAEKEANERDTPVKIIRD
jgi:hypothetical protein